MTNWREVREEAALGHRHDVGPKSNESFRMGADFGRKWTLEHDPRVKALVEAAKEVLEAEAEKNERERRKLGLKDNEYLITGNWRCNISFRELDKALATWEEK